jgi:hypothetical protein
MATAVTNDSGNRARLTVNASGGQNTISWSASVTDNSASLGGFGDSGFWNVTIGPYVVANASGTYDFGSGVYPTPYFPISDGNTLTGVPAGTYTVTGTFRGNVGSTVVGTATIDPFQVVVTDPPPPPPPPTPVWSTGTALGAATRGSAYSATVAASPSTSYSIVGQNFTTGTYSLTDNVSSAVIFGTPTATGTASVTVRANNSGSTADRTFTFTVNPALPVFSDATVNSSARVGVAYSDAVAASETASYSVFSGALPGGLSLNTSSGAITGTPTTPGTFNFVIRATNVTGSTNTGTLTITVISSARVWNGSAFVVAQARVWNGSSFVTGTIRVWDGSAWVNTK